MDPAAGPPATLTWPSWTTVTAGSGCPSSRPLPVAVVAEGAQPGALQPYAPNSYSTPRAWLAYLWEPGCKRPRWGRGLDAIRAHNKELLSWPPECTATTLGSHTLGLVGATLGSL